MRPSLPSASLILDALSERHFGTKAEGTGLEPATPCGASDFESDSSPFGYPPRSNLAVARGADKVRRSVGWQLPGRGSVKVARLHAQIAEESREVFQSVDDEVNHALFILQAAVGNPGGTAASNAIESLPDFGANHEVGEARFVLD